MSFPFSSTRGPCFLRNGSAGDLKDVKAAGWFVVRRLKVLRSKKLGCYPLIKYGDFHGGVSLLLSARCYFDLSRKRIRKVEIKHGDGSKNANPFLCSFF